MAESNSKLNRHLDKIAYGVAGLLGLLLLVLPSLMGGKVAETSAKVDAEREKLKEKIDNQSHDFPQIPPAITKQTVEEQWGVGTAAPQDPRWVTERAQALVRIFQKAPPKTAVHKPPLLTALRCERDGEKKQAYILVKGGANPENEKVVIQGFELLRKEEGGQGAEFQKVPEFTVKPVAGGDLKSSDFEYRDLGVKPGKGYAYKLVSVAALEPGSENTNPPEKERQESEPLGPTPPVPFDISIKVSLCKEDPGPNGPIVKFFGSVTFWDYKQSKLVKLSPASGFAEHEKFGDDRYEFFPIEVAVQEVEIRDTANVGHGLKVKRGGKDRPVALWPPIEAKAAAAPEDGTQAEALAPVKEAPVKEAPKPAKSAAPPKTEKPPTKPGEKPSSKPPGKKLSGTKPKF